MAFNPAPFLNCQQFDANGNPLSGGKIDTYLAGSSTLATTFKDSAGSANHTNPIILNVRGEPDSPIYLATGIAYKFIRKDALNNVIGLPLDNIVGINDVSTTTDQYLTFSGTATYISATSFSLVGDQTSTFEKGRALKLLTSGGTVFAKILSSVYTTLTTIVIEQASGALDTGITGTNPSYGIISPNNNAPPSTVDSRVQNQSATAFTTGGTSSAYTLTPIPAIASRSENQMFFVELHTDPTGSPTLAISGQAARNCRYIDSSGTKQFITSAQVKAGNKHRVWDDGTDYVFGDILPQSGDATSITMSVASNALTASIPAGSAYFRNSTLSNGNLDIVAYSAASLVVPDGATLGAPAAITSASATMAGTTTLTINTGATAPIQIGAIIFQAGTRIGEVTSLGTYVGGTGTGTVILSASATFTAQAIVIINPFHVYLLQAANGALAIVNQAGGFVPDESGLISSTAIGTGSDSNNVIYSTSSFSNQPYRLIGYAKLANATVGTYANAPELVVSGGQDILASFLYAAKNAFTDIAAQRVKDLTYRNISPRPKEVHIFCSMTSANGVGIIQVNGVQVESVTAYGAGVGVMLKATVPAGATVLLTSSGSVITLINWLES